MSSTLLAIEQAAEDRGALGAVEGNAGGMWRVVDALPVVAFVLPIGWS